MIPTKDNYIPKYDSTVTILLPLPDQPAVPVRPNYCLTPESAAELAAVLTAEGLGPISIEMRPPQLGSVRFNYSKNVPWFVYANGATENAAFVAWNWIPNRWGIVALTYATQEIQGVMHDFETTGV